MSLTQLAIAILYDLVLDKQHTKNVALMLAFDLKGSGKPSGVSWTPTMEERRALLGCFLISSVHVYFRSLLPQANICSLQVMLYFTERKHSAMRVPAMVYLKSLEAQLQDFKANIPSELSDNSKSLLPYTETHTL
jgi:hypothetical protein